MSEHPPVLCLMGPTASGKTDLAMALADVRPLDLISVDSAMVYRGMDIGTAKPTPAELARYPHALVDCCDPSVPYSVGHFIKDATAAIEASYQAGRQPCLVGGTMLYFYTLQHGISPLPTVPEEVSARLADELASEGIAALYRRLQGLDPETAARLKPRDKQRIVRALAVYESSGQGLSAHYRSAAHQQPPYTFLPVILAPQQRGELSARIAERFHAMVAKGFLAEVKQLLAHPQLTPEQPALRAAGYRQACAYLAGMIDHDTFVSQSIQATGQLAKRQMTWLRRWPAAPRLAFDDPDRLERWLALIGRSY